MAGLTNQIATGLAAEVSSLTGIVARSATPVDTIPNAPFWYVGPPKLMSVAGSWEQRSYNFPLHLLVAMTDSSDRDQVAINDFLDLTLNAFRTGITLSVATVVSAEIKAADTDKFYTLDTQEYQSIDFDCLVTCMGPASYTP